MIEYLSGNDIDPFSQHRYFCVYGPYGMDLEYHPMESYDADSYLVRVNSWYEEDENERGKVEYLYTRIVDKNTLLMLKSIFQRFSRSKNSSDRLALVHLVNKTLSEEVPE